MAFAFCGAEEMRVLKSTQGLLATLRCRAIFLYQAQTLCPSGYGDGLEIHWALPARV